VLSVHPPRLEGDYNQLHCIVFGRYQSGASRPKCTCYIFCVRSINRCQRTQKNRCWEWPGYTGFLYLNLEFGRKIFDYLFPVRFNITRTGTQEKKAVWRVWRVGRVWRCGGMKSVEGGEGVMCLPNVCGRCVYVCRCVRWCVYVVSCVGLCWCCAGEGV
jgi:hypothetical protein